MATKQVGIEAARGKLGEIADEVRSTEQPCVLTRNGLPVVVVVPLAPAGETVPVPLPAGLLERIDTYAAEWNLTRAEAVRILAGLGLVAATTSKGER